MFRGKGPVPDFDQRRSAGSVAWGLNNLERSVPRILALGGHCQLRQVEQVFEDDALHHMVSVVQLGVEQNVRDAVFSSRNFDLCAVDVLVRGAGNQIFCADAVVAGCEQPGMELD